MLRSRRRVTVAREQAAFAAASLDGAVPASDAPSTGAPAAGNATDGADHFFGTFLFSSAPAFNIHLSSTFFNNKEKINR